MPQKPIKPSPYPTPKGFIWVPHWTKKNDSEIAWELINLSSIFLIRIIDESSPLSTYGSTSFVLRGRVGGDHIYSAWGIKQACHEMCIACSFMPQNENQFQP